MVWAFEAKGLTLQRNFEYLTPEGSRKLAGGFARSATPPVQMPELLRTPEGFRIKYQASCKFILHPSRVLANLGDLFRGCRALRETPG